jgi:predicted permease
MRHAIRRLRQDPSLAVLVAATLALGVGVNSAIFSVVNGLHRPLPVRDANRLVALATRRQTEATGMEGMQYRFTYPAYSEFRAQAGSYAGLLAFELGHAGLSAGDKPQEFTFAMVSGNYFSTLGIRPAAGRLFAPGEGESAAGGLMVVLGYSCWQQRFGGDPAVVGRQVRINGAAATVVGVAERRFHGTLANVDMQGYVPLSYETVAWGRDQRGFFQDRGMARLTVMGILKPGIRRAEARTEAQVIAGRLARQYPASDRGITVEVLPETWARPAPIPSMVAMGPLVDGLFLLMGALLLALACANVGNVLLVRAADREREMAVRAALGSGRARLIGQALAEIALLAALGGAAGVLLSAWAADAVSGIPLALGNLPAALDFGLDWRVFGYALGATLAAALGAGLWPALAASRTDVAAVLHGGGRSVSQGRRGWRRLVVAAQVAGSLMLLIVAGCFAGGLANARRTQVGFEPRNLAAFTMDTAYSGYDKERSTGFYRELLRRVRNLPGVESAGLGYSMPMSFVQDGDAISVEGGPPAAGRNKPLVMFNSIGPEYFDTMRIDVRAGRGFRDSDDEHSRPVAVVNELMAQRLWPGQDAIGKRFRMLRTEDRWWEVVGVARNGKYIALFEPGLPYFYLPSAQHSTARRVLQVRSAVAPRELFAAVGREVRALDPDVAVSESRTMEEALEGAAGFWGFKLAAWLSGAMGLVGLALAVVGVYGVVSYAARRRTREIGIRMALGAGAREVFRLVLGRDLSLIAAGMAAGLAGAWGLATVIHRSVSTAIAPNAAVFAATSVFVFAVALAACYVPARRATRLDPMDALRHE